MPHKTAILDLCDDIGPEAQIVGGQRGSLRSPAWCVVRDVRRVGLVGALDAANVDLIDVDVLLVGCGGAGSAIASALANRPIRSLSLHNRSIETAEVLAERLKTRHDDIRVVYERPAASGYQIVVNATRLGVQPDDDEPVELAGASNCTIADIVTGDRRSPLLRHADELGLPTVDGIGMLEAQMSSIIQYWTDGDAS